MVECKNTKDMPSVRRAAKCAMNEVPVSVAQLRSIDKQFGPSDVHEAKRMISRSVQLKAEETRCQIQDAKGDPLSKRGGGPAHRVSKIHTSNVMVMRSKADANPNNNFKENNLEHHEFLGEIYKNLTPIKRKLKNQNNTSRLVKMFNTKTSTQEQENESPAKRRKCESGVGDQPGSSRD